MKLVSSDAHPGLVDAIAATLPGACWQRCRTHFMRNLLTRVPKSAQSFVPTMVRTIFAQPDAATVHEQHRRSSASSRRASPRPRRCLHRLPEGALAAAVEQQLTRAAQQGNPPPHRRRRDLPRPRLDRPPRRRRPRRANDEWAVAGRYTSAESIAKAIADPVDETEEMIAIAAAA